MKPNAKAEVENNDRADAKNGRGKRREGIDNAAWSRTNTRRTIRSIASPVNRNFMVRNAIDDHETGSFAITARFPFFQTIKSLNFSPIECESILEISQAGSHYDFLIKGVRRIEVTPINVRTRKAG